jgi:hypothetical protein
MVSLVVQIYCICDLSKETDSIAAGVGTATGVGFPSEPSTVADTGASPSTQRPPRLAKGWGAGALKRQTADSEGDFGLEGAFDLRGSLR